MSIYVGQECVDCPHCGGDGYLTVEYAMAHGEVGENNEQCPMCGSFGSVVKKDADEYCEERWRF